MIVAPGAHPRRGRWALVALVAALTMPGAARAAGPLFVNGAGAPLVWDAAPIPWNPDLGGLGAFDNVTAVQLVDASFGVWAAVPTAAVTFVDAGPLPVDVTASNARSFIGVCGDGLSPIVFDADGSVTDSLLGIGASNSILGFAGPECGTFTPPRITEASAVLNGKFIDGIVNAGNPEISLTDFTAVFVHEFGHYVNLDHSQVNLLEAFDGSAEDDAAVATMFPILVNGAEELTLERDDEVSLSMLYPAPGLASLARITGQVLESDGVTPFQGAYVIARNVADPRRDAVGCASGSRYFPGALGGPPDASLRGAYELAGLTVDAEYTVEVEAIYQGFTGGSSVGPFDVPRELPGPPEFWSGANEAASDPPDDPAAPGARVPTSAGVTVSGIDIVLNTDAPPPNDDCDAAATIAAFPFAATLATGATTASAGDPSQACTRGGAAQNGRSVWYRLVAPADGTVSLSTAGSTYDTVLSAYIGACGGLAAVACNDDAAGDVRSATTFPVSAGTQYLVEVTAEGTSSGGTLALAASFDPLGRGTCEAVAPGTCIAGGGGRATDCAAEFLLEPPPPSSRRNVLVSRHTCTDGDPRCDFDGVANGRCSFHVGVCLNNHDPRPAARRCVPSGIVAFEVSAPRLHRARDAVDVQNATSLLALVADLAAPSAVVNGNSVEILPAFEAPDRCSAFQTFTVPRGSRTFRTRVRTASGRRDVDTLRLRCTR